MNFYQAGRGSCRCNHGNSVRYTGQPCSVQPNIIQPRTPQQYSEAAPLQPARDNQAVGMAYIPVQQFDNLYDAKCGLTEGTMFKDLNLIFCGVRGRA